ncbi:hypothetical protein PIB30_055890 [Stylosanthes scabra]|uniref:Uncharacterized protein n=1 Tax=Stylosanthes scabra TaxID=79078 RepID=A0ABU6YKD2_9FABA|nr:hypothetical protein [Stylosanthes scabra]
MLQKSPKKKKEKKYILQNKNPKSLLSESPVLSPTLSSSSLVSGATVSILSSATAVPIYPRRHHSSGSLSLKAQFNSSPPSSAVATASFGAHQPFLLVPAVAFCSRAFHFRPSCSKRLVGASDSGHTSF